MSILTILIISIHEQNIYFSKDFVGITVNSNTIGIISSLYIIILATKVVAFLKAESFSN